MKLYIAFDDTDNLESPGTGHILEDFRTLVESRGWGNTERITRHQLYFHPDVPYTSHNSAMCFVLNNPKVPITEIETAAVDFIVSRSAPGSDPGLCLLDDEVLRNPALLTAFGSRAKKEVLSKALAWETAAACGIRLSEHGGTGDGVIGALAGTALRRQGKDGRFRGQLEGLEAETTLTTKELLGHPGIDRVKSLEPDASLEEGTPLTDGDETVFLTDKPKTILQGGEAVFLVRRGPDENRKLPDTTGRTGESGAAYISWSRKDLKRF